MLSYDVTVAVFESTTSQQLKVIACYCIGTNALINTWINFSLPLPFANYSTVHAICPSTEAPVPAFRIA